MVKIELFSWYFFEVHNKSRIVLIKTAHWSLLGHGKKFNPLHEQKYYLVNLFTKN